jgi:hypothetical protein
MEVNGQTMAPARNGPAFQLNWIADPAQGRLSEILLDYAVLILFSRPLAL